MAPSPVSGRKMRNVLVGIILGLLAVVHTTPVNTVTQIPTEAVDEIIQGEGFIVDHSFFPSLTTESPKRNTTVHASRQPSVDSDVGSAGQGGEESVTSLSFHHEGDHYATTTQTVSHAQSSSTVSSRDVDDSSSDSTTTQSPQSGFTSSSVPNEAKPSVTQDHISVSQTSDPATALMPHEATQLLEEESGSGLGSETSTAPSTNLSLLEEGSGLGSETSTAPSTTTTVLMPHEATQLFEDETGSGLGSETSTAPSTTTTVLMSHEATQLLEDESGSGLGSETSTAPSTTMTANEVEEENKDSESGEETSTAPSTTTPIIKADSRRINSEENKGLGSESGKETSTAPSTTMAIIKADSRRINFVENKGLGSESGKETVSEPSASTVAPTEQASPVIADQEAENKHTTPGWIIILGFVVGVAALIMLLVAIATRDKWNGPNQVSQLETKADSSNQQRGVEMETFLHREKPKENGKAAEYTVIPLDDFPENYSSH